MKKLTKCIIALIIGVAISFLVGCNKEEYCGLITDIKTVNHADGTKAVKVDGDWYTYQDNGQPQVGTYYCIVL